MRLIDADELGIGFANPDVFEYPHYAYGWNSAIEIIGNAPTIDAEPVRHGHWVKLGGYVCGDYEFVCSVCGDCRWEGRGLPNRAHYCQCCGAKMDEVSE